MSGAMSSATRSTTGAEWANAAKTVSRWSLKTFDVASSGCATGWPALLDSGRILTESPAARSGSRTMAVTRSSMAAQVSGGAKAGMRKKPLSVHEARCSGVTSGAGAGAVVAVAVRAAPAPAPCGSEWVVGHPIGCAGGSGRSPGGRGQAMGVTSLAITAPMAMPARSTEGCGNRPSPRGRSVGEVDGGVHPTDGTGGVGPRQVEGESVVEGDGPGRDLDPDGLQAGQLGVNGQRVVVGAGRGGEDVDERAQAEPVAAREVAHGAALEGGAVEGDPGGDGVGLDDGPVRVVLVGVGLPAAALLVQRLVVPEAHGVDAQEAGGGAADERVEAEGADVGGVLPEVLALDEGLLVSSLLGQEAGVVAAAPGHGLVDGGAVPLELVGREEVGDDDEAVAAEGLDEVGRRGLGRRGHGCSRTSRMGPTSSRTLGDSIHGVRSMSQRSVGDGPSSRWCGSEAMKRPPTTRTSVRSSA